MSSADSSLSTPTMDPEYKSLENELPSKKAIVSFLDLPRELRDMIYRSSVAAGYLGILSTSKLVNEEACQFLSTHAVLRVNMGWVNPTDWARLTSGPMNTPQHVEFCLDTGLDSFSIDIGAISEFTGKNMIRESCLVTVNNGKEGSATGNIQYDRLYLELHKLTGFKRVVVKIVIEKYTASEFEGLLTEEKFMEIFPYSTALLSHHVKSYEKVRWFLESSLGPAKFNDSVDGHCLEFHPLEPFPKNRNPGVIEGWK